MRVCACVCACVRTRVRHLGAMFVEELQGQVCRSTSALENVQRMREANSHQHAAWPWQRTVGEPCMSPHGRCPLLVCTSALLSMCSGTSTWLSRGFTTTCGGMKHTLSRHCSPYTHTRMHARTHTHTHRQKDTSSSSASRMSTFSAGNPRSSILTSPMAWWNTDICREEARGGLPQFRRKRTSSSSLNMHQPQQIYYSSTPPLLPSHPSPSIFICLPLPIPISFPLPILILSPHFLPQVTKTKAVASLTCSSAKPARGRNARLLFPNISLILCMW